jgi:hypothetical protein
VWPADTPKDDHHLREVVLRVRLGRLVNRLIGSKGEKSGELTWALWRIICASYLNTFAPALSVQKRFDGALKRKKDGLRDITSISLFVDDVECLLRDSYGNVEDEAINRAGLGNLHRAISGVSA